MSSAKQVRDAVYVAIMDLLTHLGHTEDDLEACKEIARSEAQRLADHPEMVQQQIKSEAWDGLGQSVGELLAGKQWGKS